MLVEAAAAIVINSTPLWVYIVGAGGSSAAILFGAWALYARVRTERDKEVRERADNTNATNSNTEAVNNLSRKFGEFVEVTERRFRANEKGIDQNTRELEEIRRQRSNGR